MLKLQTSIQTSGGALRCEPAVAVQRCCMTAPCCTWTALHNVFHTKWSPSLDRVRTGLPFYFDLQFLFSNEFDFLYTCVSCNWYLERSVGVRLVRSGWVTEGSGDSLLAPGLWRALTWRVGLSLRGFHKRSARWLMLILRG